MQALPQRGMYWNELASIYHLYPLRGFEQLAFVLTVA